MANTVTHIKTAENGASGVKRDKKGRIQKGSAPINPRGRPKSGVNVFLEKVRTAAINTALPLLIEAAKNGDTDAAKTLLLAGLPKVKAITPMDAIPTGTDTNDAAAKVQAILSLIERGEVTQEQAQIMLTGTETLLRAREQEEINARITALEDKQKEKQESGVLIVPGVLQERDWLKEVQEWDQERCTDQRQA